MLGFDVSPLTPSSRTRRSRPPPAMRLRLRKSSHTLCPTSRRHINGFIVHRPVAVRVVEPSSPPIRDRAWHEADLTSDATADGGYRRGTITRTVRLAEALHDHGVAGRKPVRCRNEPSFPP